MELKALEELEEDIETYSQLDQSSDQDYWNALRVVRSYEEDKKRRQQKVKHLGDGIHDSVTDDVTLIFEGKSFSELEELEREIKAKVTDGDTPDPEYWNSLLNNLKIFLAKAKLREIHQYASSKRLQLLKEQKEQALRTNAVDLISQYNEKREERGGEEKEEREEVLDEENLEELRRKELEKEAQRLLERSNQLAYKNSERSSSELLSMEREKGLGQGEEYFNLEVAVNRTYEWAREHTPQKPQYFNRVKIGYEWTKYNRTHFDSDNPPPKIVKGYRFNIFYPDLINTKKAPSYSISKGESDEWTIITFHAGAPYEDIAFKIVNREWEYSHQRGFKSVFDRGVYHLFFNFKKYRYRR